MTLSCWLTRFKSAWLIFGEGLGASSPSIASAGFAGGTRSMYTLRKRCLPIFHSTSTTSRPSERATRSAASRTFSKFNRRLPSHCRLQLHSYRPNKKVGLRPPIRATRFRAKTEYIPPARQKQDTARNPGLSPIPRLHPVPGQAIGLTPPGHPSSPPLHQELSALQG